MASDNRKTLFIDKPLQLFFFKLISGSCILCIFAMLFSSFGFYLSLRDLYLRSENPQLLRILNLINDYMWIYLIYAGTSLILCAMVISYAWLVISNRFAGPAYRIRKNIEAYTQGEKFIKIKLREKDALVNLADAVNNLVKKLAPNDYPPDDVIKEKPSLVAQNNS